MTAWVVDASVVIKWFIPEIHSREARRLLIDDNELTAPELLLVEVDNTLWKKVRAGELQTTEAREIIAELQRLPMRIVRMAPYVENALALAIMYQRTVYDCIYVAIAIHEGSCFVTADQKLSNSLVNTDIADGIVHVEELN